MDEKELVARLVSEISNSRFTWRTVKRLAEQIGVTSDEILAAVHNSGQFFVSRNPRKGVLITTRQKYAAETPIQKRILSGLTNQFH